MTKAHSPINWQNSPSVSTPINESNLNKMDKAIGVIDDRVVALDTTKANVTDLLTAVSDVTFDEKTGTFTVKKKNGATTKIDTKLEKLAVNFTYDATNQRLVLTLDDGTIQYVDLKTLVTELDFLDSNTVFFYVNNGKVTANILKGSITDEYLEPNYLANLKVYAEQASSSASTAVESANIAKTNADLAKTYSDGAIDAVAQIDKKLKIAEFDVNEDGYLVYNDDASYNFAVDDNGYLNWEVAE